MGSPCSIPKPLSRPAAQFYFVRPFATLTSGEGHRLAEAKMRPLSDEETMQVFDKLKKYVGQNLKQLVERQDETHVFRLQKERVYYVGEKTLKKAGHAQRKKLVSAGVCFGKFTHTKKFRLGVTALDIL